MPIPPRIRAGALFLAVLTTTWATITVAQRGGGGGGGGNTGGGQTRSSSSPTTSTQPRGSTSSTANPFPPLGARGDTGQRGQRGQQEKKELADPTDGLVLAYVTVTTRDHQSVPGLTAKNFRITEDNVDQKIELFSVENGPLTIGFVLGGPPSESRTVPLAFLKATPWMNEFFLIHDDGNPPGGTVIQNFTTDLTKATTIYPQGGVSKDSIYIGLDYMKESANHRKILLLIGGTLNGDSSGGGLSPDYVERVAVKQDVQVYSIITSNDGNDDTLDDGGGTSDIVRLTGGRSYQVPSFSAALESTAAEFAHGLGVQYEIGYRPTNIALDGKWRKIRVSVVDPPESAGKLSVWTKAGYYADKAKKSK